MKKIAANVSHGRIKTFNPVRGLRRFEQYCHELFEPINQLSLSCLRACFGDVLWAMTHLPFGRLVGGKLSPHV